MFKSKFLLAQGMRVPSPWRASVPAVPADEARKQVNLLADRINNISLRNKSENIKIHTVQTVRLRTVRL